MFLNWCEYFSLHGLFPCYEEYKHIFHMVIFYYYDQINFKIHGVWNFKIKYLKN